MGVLKHILNDRRCRYAALILLILAAIAGVMAWRAGMNGTALTHAWHQTEAFLASRPWWLVGALVILPALPVPTSALLILAGTVWRDRPVLACAVCLTTMALNMSWTYWLAAWPGRRWVIKLLASTPWHPPAPQRDQLKLILLMRLTPGLPFFIQNYVLGFFRVPFRAYLIVSMTCSGIIACGVVLSAAGLTNGKIVPALAGIGLLVAGTTLVHLIRNRLKLT